MRLYTFINMYLSSIQQGIQTAHIVGDLFIKYEDTHNLKGTLRDWAINHKTIIVLNGGYSSDIEELGDFFLDPENYYPWIDFRESREALDSALTGVGIILPERIYSGVGSIDELYEFSQWELQLIERLNTYSLAR